MGRCGLVGGWLSWMVRASDSLGTTYELNCQGDSSFRTVLGGFLSLGCLAVTLTYLYQQSVSMIEQTNFKVTDVIDYPQGDLKIDLVASQLLPVIFFMNKTNYMALPSAFQPSVATFVGELVYTYLDMTKNSAVSRVTQFEVKSCGELINKKPYRAFFEEPRFKALVGVVTACLEIPENQTLTIYGGRLDMDSSLFRIAAYPCSTGQCLPQSKFSELQVGTMSQKKYIKFTDYNDPVKDAFVAVDNLNIFSGDLGYETRSYFETTRLRDHTFLLSEPTNERVFSSLKDSTQTMVQRDPLQTTCTKEQIKQHSCSLYFSLEYMSSGISHDIMRDYPDFLQVLSDVGGFKEIIFVSVGVLYCFYNELMKKKFLGLKLVSMKELLIFFDNDMINVKESKKELDLVGALGEHRLPTHEHRQVHPVVHDYRMAAKDELIKPHSNIKHADHDEPHVAVSQTNRKTNNPSEVHVAQHTGGLSHKKYTRSLTKLKEKEGEDVLKDFEVKDLLNRAWTFKHFKKFISLRSEVVALLELNSDITQITKEMTCFGVLKEVLFTPYQLKLLPLVSIELHRKRLQQQRLSAEGTQSPTDPLVQNICSFVGETLKYREALESLLESVEGKGVPTDNRFASNSHRPAGNQQPIDALSQIRFEIDCFIMKNLPDFVAVHLKPIPETNDDDHLDIADKNPEIGLEHRRFDNEPQLQRIGGPAEKIPPDDLHASHRHTELKKVDPNKPKAGSSNKGMMIHQKVKLHTKMPPSGSRRPSRANLMSDSQAG